MENTLDNLRWVLGDHVCKCGGDLVETHNRWSTIPENEALVYSCTGGCGFTFFVQFTSLKPYATAEPAPHKANI